MILSSTFLNYEVCFSNHNLFIASQHSPTIIAYILYRRPIYLIQAFSLNLFDYDALPRPPNYVLHLNNAIIFVFYLHSFIFAISSVLAVISFIV